MFFIGNIQTPNSVTFAPKHLYKPVTPHTHCRTRVWHSRNHKRKYVYSPVPQQPFGSIKVDDNNPKKGEARKPYHQGRAISIR